MGESLVTQADDAIAAAIRNARAVGVGWDELAQTVGITRQAIAKRYLRD